MNIKKMFAAQQTLRDKIGYNEPDRLEKTVLALLAEIGETLQEWRGFKYWSKDQTPRTSANIECFVCWGTGDENYEYIQEDAEGDGKHEYIECENCEGGGYSGQRNPLLEEYADGWALIIELGLDVNAQSYFDVEMNFNIGGRTKFGNPVALFLQVNEQVIDFYKNRCLEAYERLISMYATLGDAIGLNDHEIEAAYFQKNAENIRRQEAGY